MVDVNTVQPETKNANNNKLYYIHYTDMFYLFWTC